MDILGPGRLQFDGRKRRASFQGGDPELPLSAAGRGEGEVQLSGRS